MKHMKKGKTFLTFLAMAGAVTAVTLGVSNIMTHRLEQELAQKTNANLEKLIHPTPSATMSPKPAVYPTLPPSPTPLTTPEPTPEPTPKLLRLSIPATGSEVLADYTEDVLVFQATYQDYRTHLGIDFGGEDSTPVYAAADGTVTKNSFDYEQGYTVELTHYDGYITRYSNLAGDNVVTVGQQILQGEQIGTMGTSGIWESHLPCHLHFELEQNGTPLNPRDYFQVSLNAE